MPLTKAQHLDPALSPKRILALDGGGIRGILTLQFLQAVETEIKARFGDKTRLCDYFDLIGGTSTGSIIAAGLACGMTVDALQNVYRSIGASVFQPGGLGRLLPELLQGTLAPKFPSGPLQAELDRQLGAETTLDSDRILTGLMIMTKRLDTGSPWPLDNGGRGKFAAQDGALRLTEIVRASTAAPTYFAPEKIPIHSRDGSVVDGAFVDGGVTPFNDPALQLLMMAALQGHGLCWPTGKDKLLIVSVGTGQYREFAIGAGGHRRPGGAPGDRGAAIAHGRLRADEPRDPAMADQLPHALDHRSGRRRHETRQPERTSARHLRPLQRRPGAALAQDRTRRRPRSGQGRQIRKMDDPSNMTDLSDLGRMAAAKQVQPDHLPVAFDIAKTVA